MTAMGKQRELRQHWQRAAKLIPAKADVMEVSRALELALFMDAKLDVSKVPAEWKAPAQSLGAPGLGLGFTFKQIGAYVPIRFR